MALTDAQLFVHGTGSTAGGAISVSAGVYGDTLGYAGSAYSNVELDFGAPGSASSYPYVSQFPGYTEAAYNAAGYSQAESVGAGGVPWGLHIQVMSAFNTLTTLTIDICTSATTGATYNSTGNPIASRVLSLAQLIILGAHYFIPVNPTQVLEFLRFYAVVASSNPTTGTIIAWFGPRTGDEM